MRFRAVMSSRLLVFFSRLLQWMATLSLKIRQFNIGGFVGWTIRYFLFNSMTALKWLWQILQGRYQIINNHRVLIGTGWNYTCHTCAICLPCCRSMSHNVATNWLFRICLKHRCSIHLSYHLVCYNYSNTKLTKKWIFSLCSLVHEIFFGYYAGDY